jgi:hypothetical protein
MYSEPCHDDESLGLRPRAEGTRDSGRRTRTSVSRLGLEQLARTIWSKGSKGERREVP